MTIVQAEINEIVLKDARVYKRPEVLRMREYYHTQIRQQFEPNT